MPCIISFTSSGKLATTYTVHANNGRAPWIQGNSFPDSATVRFEDGTERTKTLSTGYTSKRTRKATASFSDGAKTILLCVSEGVDPSRPSWTFTVKAKGKGEVGGCSVCHSVTVLAFDLRHDAPICPKCLRERNGGTP